jgi:hypothetical protein
MILPLIYQVNKEKLPSITRLCGRKTRSITTKKLANYIQEAMGAFLTQIKPKDATRR